MKLLALFTLLLALSACKSGVGATPEKAQAANSAEPESDGRSIRPDQRLLGQLRVGPVTASPVGEEITVAARIEVNDNRMARIGSPVTGRVASLFAVVGQRVKHGDALALVSSTALSDGQLAFLKALTQEQVARRAVERAQVLLKAEVIGVAELQRRQAELAEAEAGRDAARDQLLLLGMPAETIAHLEQERRIDSTARIVSSLDGVVMKRNVTVGQIAQPADALFEIADLSQVWLVADVPSSDANHVEVGMDVEAAVGSPPLLNTRGRLDFVSSTVDPETRTVRVRMTLPNRTGRLRPALLATMTLRARTEMKPCVPLAAVVRDEDQEYVFTRDDQGVFGMRPVKLGPGHKSCRPLLEGLEQNQAIVLDGAFHLNNERRRRAQRSGGEP